MQEHGVVIASDDGQVTVELDRSSACDKCGGCSMSPKGTMHATARNNIEASLGDSVVIALDETTILKAAAIVYLVPLLAAILGFFIVSSLAQLFTESSAGIGAIGAVIGLGAAFLGVSRYDSKAGKDGTYSFRLERERQVNAS